MNSILAIAMCGSVCFQPTDLFLIMVTISVLHVATIKSEKYPLIIVQCKESLWKINLLYVCLLCFSFWKIFGLSHNDHVQNFIHQWALPGLRYEYLFWWYLATDVPIKSTKQAKLIRLSEGDLFEINSNYQLLDMLELVCVNMKCLIKTISHKASFQPINYRPFIEINSS